MSRVRRYLQRILRQSIPDGLISVRYLLPFQSPLVKLHRRVWWHSKHPQIPRIIWLGLQCFFWLRWVLFSGWMNIYRTIKFLGSDIKTHYGVNYSVQIARSIRATIGWCIPANEFFSFGFEPAGRNPLDYIYTTETKGWHALQNMDHPNAQAGHRFLGDKRAFARQMAEQGFPVVSEIRRFAPYKSLSSQLLESDGAVFCKLRQGNQALNAFEAIRNGDAVMGTTHKGEALKTSQEVDAAWVKLGRSGMPIVQPLLINHPKIHQITQKQQLATLRVITRNGRVGAANITLPFDSKKGQLNHWLLVDPSTGVLSFPKDTIKPYFTSYDDAQMLAKRAPNAVPFWDKICEHSLAAHANDLDLWAIAWDWGITPDGPILLEGNSGWGLEDWQLQNGSLAS